MSVTSLHWCLPFLLPGFELSGLAWVTPPSKRVNAYIGTMNRSSQLLYHLLLARQECDYTKLTDSKMMDNALGMALKFPWFPKLVFPVVQIKRKGCGQETLAGLGPQHCVSGRQVWKTTHQQDLQHLPGGRIHWGSVHTSSWRGACRRDKWVTKVSIAVIADTAALFLFSCSTVLPNSYHNLYSVPAVDGNTSPIDMEGLLAGRAELQKFC